ncbi:uncharacterized protein PAC_13182 [Phialocephala subalpina]|uniref:Uncharacterized protein n=1 Tax=Phialocephala subalpina TaxID=576137 RepID=A0A1L7XE31_9HELO|nr:uncharacterized protein PAC_13182 [Phialocephala subalpina]
MLPLGCNEIRHHGRSRSRRGGGGGGGNGGGSRGVPSNDPGPDAPPGRGTSMPPKKPDSGSYNYGSQTYDTVEHPHHVYHKEERIDGGGRSWESAMITAY